MAKAKRYFVVLSSSSVEVGGSEEFDNSVRVLADELGGTVVDPDGNIVYDAAIYSSGESSLSAESPSSSPSEASFHGSEEPHALIA